MTMSKNENSLLCLLKIAFQGIESDLCAFESLTLEDWIQVRSLAERQGVSVIAFEAIDILSKSGIKLNMHRKYKSSWIAKAAFIENNYHRQMKDATALTKLWMENGIRTLVFKGLALSRYYPVPEHREFCDFDCYLFGEFEKGNKVAFDAGCNVDTGWYKHSQIRFYGLMVENHNYFTQCRKVKKERELNKELVACLGDGSSLQPFEGTDMLLPPLPFEGLFIVYHAMTHFLLEGLSLRAFCDWTCWMKANQSKIDWMLFYARCSYYGFDRFVDAMNAICVDYFGLVITNTQIYIDRTYEDKVLENTLYEDSKLYNKGSKWYSRFGVIRNAFKYSWKFREIAQYSMIEFIWSYVRGFVFRAEND